MCQVPAQEVVQGGSPASSAPACPCGHSLSTTPNSSHSLLGQPSISPTFEGFGWETDHGAQRLDEEEI